MMNNAVVQVSSKTYYFYCRLAKFYCVLTYMPRAKDIQLEIEVYSPSWSIKIRCGIPFFLLVPHQFLASLPPFLVLLRPYLWHRPLQYTLSWFPCLVNSPYSNYPLLCCQIIILVKHIFLDQYPISVSVKLFFLP